MKCFLRLNDLFSQGSRQGTLMPGLLNFLYEQLSYHKILPFVCKLSIEISHRRPILVNRVPGDLMRNFTIMAEPSRQKPDNARRLCDNFKKKFMSDHKVFCAKLKQELPGLSEPPFDGDLGKKIYEQVSQQAWGQWMEHCKMLLNEYRLNPARKQDQEVIVKQMEQFFFGEGAARPAEYVPPAH